MRLLQSKSTIKFLETLLRNCPLDSDQLKQQFASFTKQEKITYNTPHPPRDPPEDYNPEKFEHPAFVPPDCVPLAVFRPFSSNTEILGPNASKENCYKNPEYYSYHRYSFVALQVQNLDLQRNGPIVVTLFDDTASEEFTTSDEEVLPTPCKKDENDGSTSTGSEDSDTSDSSCSDM